MSRISIPASRSVIASVARSSSIWVTPYRTQTDDLQTLKYSSAFRLPTCSTGTSGKFSTCRHRRVRSATCGGRRVRSDERREGRECGRKGRYGGSTELYKKKTANDKHR